MLKAISRSVILTLVLTIILCGIFPLAVTGIGRVLFREKANGSIVRGKDGRVIGSKLIGQAFTKPQYFHPRPSSAGNGYDASNSSGSNLGPTSQKFYDAVKANVETALKENPTLKKGQIPVDMVTSSASGLDPDISPENAYAQADRVAAARKMSIDQIKRLIKRNIEGPQWGIFGQQVVNVLSLNLELDRLVSNHVGNADE